MTTTPTIYSHRLNYRFTFAPDRVQRTRFNSQNEVETVEGAREWLSRWTGATFEIIDIDGIRTR